jgi:hypothetical protein
MGRGPKGGMSRPTLRPPDRAATRNRVAPRDRSGVAPAGGHSASETTAFSVPPPTPKARTPTPAQVALMVASP